MKQRDGNFEWDTNKAKSNFAKHGVTFQEAKEVFDDVNAAELYDEDHSRYEHRYNLIGQSSQRLLFLVFTVSQAGIVNLISAREADHNHRILYEEEFIKNNFSLE